MHVFSVRFFNTNKGGQAVQLAHAEDTSPFPFYARMSGSASELLLFLSRTFVSYTERGKAQGCREGEHNGWIYHNSEGLAGVVICDKDYDQRLAMTLIRKYMAYYTSRPDNWDWSLRETDNDASDERLKAMLTDYQTPEKVDKITEINKNIAQTKIHLHDSIDKMLERGEKIDTLVDKSQDLSRQSKQFYKKSRKLNSWCQSCTIS